MRLLFVDDEDNFQEFLARSLTAHEVETVDHWSQALDRLSGAAVRPDVIFVDPLSAQADLRQVFADARPTPVVVLSVSRDPRAIVKAMRGGARDYLCKPFSLNELQRVVQEATRPAGQEEGEAITPAVSRQKNIDFVFCSSKM